MNMNKLAWHIAGNSEATPAEAQRAVDLAQKAVAATNRKDSSLLDTLAAAYARLGQFSEAVTTQEEAIRQVADLAEKHDFTQRLSLYQAQKPYTDHAQYAGILAGYTSSLLKEGKFVEAESAGRKSLAIRERDYLDDWRTFNTRGLLGGALLGQKNHAEVEPFLLSAYEGMKQREASIRDRRKVFSETLQSLVQLYEETGRPDQAAEWRRKLAELPTPAK